MSFGISSIINAEAVRNEEIALNEKEYRGRFIIASNDLNLDAEKMLDYYKNQSKVEKEFRFIKDKNFRVSDIYLKKPQRVESINGNGINFNGLLGNGMETKRMAKTNKGNNT